VAALGEVLRARAAGAAGADEVLRGVLATYAAWRPRPELLGAPKEGLKAGATGAFWLGPALRGRVLVLSGGITGEGTAAFQEALEASAEGVEWLLVDVAQLTYVGSSGLAQVVKVAERLAGRKGGMSLFALSSSLQILVEMLGVERFLNPVAGLAEALACAGVGRKR
jgi:anti-anti-sigma factor